MSWVRSLSCADIMGTHYIGTPPLSPSFFNPIPTPSPLPWLFLLSVIQRPAVGHLGSITTLLCPGSYRAAIILLVTSSWWTNMKKKYVSCGEDWYKFKWWEKTDGLLPGYLVFSSLCCWLNHSVIRIINGLDVSVCYFHPYTVAV